MSYQVRREGTSVVRMQGRSPGTATRETYVFLPLPGERVRLCYRLEMRFSGWRRAAAPLLARRTGRLVNAALANLQALLNNNNAACGKANLKL
jgi:hypothetical protein